MGSHIVSSTRIHSTKLFNSRTTYSHPLHPESKWLQSAPTLLTRHSPLYHMLSRKLQQCLGVAEVEVVITVDEEEGVAEEILQHPINKQTRPLQGRSIRVQNILIYQQGSGKGAVCTSAGGKVLFSAMNPKPAPGRTFTPPNQQSETGASSDQILVMTR